MHIGHGSISLLDFGADDVEGSGAAGVGILLLDFGVFLTTGLIGGIRGRVEVTLISSSIMSRMSSSMNASSSLKARWLLVDGGSTIVSSIVMGSSFWIVLYKKIENKILQTKESLVG